LISPKGHTPPPSLPMPTLGKRERRSANSITNTPHVRPIPGDTPNYAALSTSSGGSASTQNQQEVERYCRWTAAPPSTKCRRDDQAVEAVQGMATKQTLAVGKLTLGVVIKPSVPQQGQSPHREPAPPPLPMPNLDTREGQSIDSRHNTHRPIRRAKSTPFTSSGGSASAQIQQGVKGYCRRVVASPSMKCRRDEKSHVILQRNCAAGCSNCSRASVDDKDCCLRSCTEGFTRCKDSSPSREPAPPPLPMPNLDMREGRLFNSMHKTPEPTKRPKDTPFTSSGVAQHLRRSNKK